ncbi:hypothetical protein [Saliphagus sp. LR7]|uniref:hypothetical protein n=1 Tax=Saliphagus sp. LR7 TaxID=2282654 RepID=UPI000DF75C7D|nr:hypothetical protein [Saliphagus sp. LR7]
MKNLEDPRTFDHDGFFEGLTDWNQDRFEEEFEENLDGFDAEDLDRKLSVRFDEREEHLKLLQAVTAGFHPRGGSGCEQSGFKYLGVNPLCSVKKTPADAILVKNEYNGTYICVICCEIGGEDQAVWVRNVNEAREVLDSPMNRDLLKSQLGVEGTDISFQYVTLTRSDDAVSMDYSVLNRNCAADSYTVWVADVEEKWMAHEAGPFLHTNLENLFEEQLDYMRREDPLKYAVGTHPVFPLEDLVYQIVKEKFDFGREYKSEFTREAFIDILDENLQIRCSGDRRERIVTSEAERLTDKALKTGVFSESEDDLKSDDHDLRVMYSGTRGPGHAERAVRPKYLENIADVEVGRKAYEKTRREFDRDSNLNDWSG